MSAYAQQIPYVLPTHTVTAGARATQTLRDIPKQYLGRLVHVSRIIFRVTDTPTYATAPTVAGQNAVAASVDFWDGSINRFLGGFNHMRAKEILQTGRFRVPDEDTGVASASSRYWGRILHMGPPHMAGSPTDFIIPAGMLENGEIRFLDGALTDQSADTTVVTGNFRLTVGLTLMDEIRIPPAYQFINQSTTAADLNLAGRSLYETIAIANSVAFGTLASLPNAVQNVRLDLGSGDVVPVVRAPDLTVAWWDDFAAGEVGLMGGDTESATLDAGAKKVNRGTPTALTLSDNVIQPVLWTPPDSKISKLQLAESVARLRWDGGTTTFLILAGRILPQPPSVVATLAAKSLGRLGRQPKVTQIKTLSKQPYTGPYVEFMPWQIKV